MLTEAGEIIMFNLSCITNIQYALHISVRGSQQIQILFTNLSTHSSPAFSLEYIVQKYLNC
jgi:hypothetical protein